MNNYIDLRPYSRQPFRSQYQQEVLRRVLNVFSEAKTEPIYIVEFNQECFAITQLDAINLIEDICLGSSGHSEQCGISRSIFSEKFATLNKFRFDFELLKYQESEWMIPEVTPDFDLYVSWDEISKHTQVTLAIDDVSKLTENLPVGLHSSVEWSRMFRWIVKQKYIYFTSKNVRSEFNQLFAIPEDKSQNQVCI